MIKALGIFTWIAISSLLTALIQAAALRQLWAWFVAADYGAGPSLGAWFGIATILGLLIRQNQPTPSKSSSEESWDEVTRRSITTALGGWLGIGLTVAVAWVTGSMLGWLS